ncbi:MAG: prolyl-tRNA synthetase associated domain-containing protein [Candidatus Latescibacterota bacterium]|nr:MAG: prolyl-tRNA synthetase associated domain-containing protein [Candidatus Latescibacterota bacterium]
MNIYEFLDTHDIAYQRYDHPAVFTCEEADRLVPPMPGAKTKNLFLYDKKEDRHFLVVVECSVIVDLKALSGALGVKKLALASERRLSHHLGLDAGAVTVLGLINDTRGAVEVVIDRELWGCKMFRCHPLVNTSSLAISKQDLERFIDLTGHTATILDVPQKRSGTG